MPIYDNFDDAWANFSGGYSGLIFQMQGFEVDLTKVLTATTWGKLKSATWACFVHLRNAFVAHVSPGGFGADWTGASHYTSVYYAWEETGDAAELNMDAIIAAMIQAERAHIEQFIGLVDAYRVKLWNARFDFGFYNTVMEHLPSWG